MTREERLEKIEAECKYTTERTSNLHFLLSELKKLEAENALLRPQNLEGHAKGFWDDAIALQKENAELRAQFNTRGVALETLQSKLDRAQNIMKDILKYCPKDGEKGTACVFCDMGFSGYSDKGKSYHDDRGEWVCPVIPIRQVLAEIGATAPTVSKKPIKGEK